MTTENWREELRKSLYERHFSTTQAEESYLEVEAMIDSLLSKERNEVLDEVKKEVEKQKRDNVFVPDHTPSMYGGLICRACGGQEDCFCSVCNEVIEEISALLEKLKVK